MNKLSFRPIQVEVELAQRMLFAEHLRDRGLTFRQFRTFVDEVGTSGTAYVGGSTVAPCGNPYSDIDLFLIVDTRREVVPPRALSLGAHRVDVETWHVDTLDELNSRLVPHLDLSVGHAPLSFNQEKLIFRMLNGLPVANVHRFLELRGRVSRDAMRVYRTIRCRTMAVNRMQDCLGALKAGHGSYALLAGRAALDWAVDAYHSLRGVPYSNKYRIFALRTYCADNSFEAQYHALHAQWPDTEPESATLATEVARTVQRLLRHVSFHLDADPAVYYSEDQR